MTLLERGPQLAELGRHLEAAASGQGRIVFIGGEAGIGKTSLVDAFCRSAQVARTLRGACDPLATPRPLGPLIDMLDWLGEDFAELVWSGERRERIFRSFLERLSVVGDGALVVFEDVHWADDATLDLVRYLSRRVGNVPALVLVTYRDDEVGPKHPFRLVLGDAAGLPSTQRLTLRPLSENSIALLAAATRREVDAADLHAKTGGNPFYVTEILAVGPAELPDTVVDAVLARAGRLKPEARRALDAAAVVGPRSEPDLLMRVAGVSAADIEACLAGGMLVPTERGVTFRHELARQALLEAMPSTMKVQLHRQVLEQLSHPSVANRDIDYAAMAHHAEGARDAEAVIRYAPVAARQAAAVHAHREARSHYARALRFAAQLPESEHLSLLEEYALECRLTDHLDEAIEAYRVAAGKRQSRAEMAQAAMDFAVMSRCLVGAGRNAESEEAVDQAIRVADEAGDARTRAYARTTWAYLRMLNRDNIEAGEGARSALELATDIADKTISIVAHNVLGCVLILTGEESEGREELLESKRLAEAIGQDVLVADAFANLGSAFGEVHRFGESDRWLAVGMEYCADRDLDSQRLYMLAWRSLTHAYQGRWAQASEDATAVVRRPGSAAISRMMALIALGRIRARRGDPEAWAALDEALELAEASGTLQRVGPVRAARAELAWLEGDPDRCAREARAAFDLALGKRHPWFAGELAYWRWKAGELESAPDVAADPYRLQTEGRCLEAATLWDGLRCPYERARALAESDDADALLTAGAVFADLGARPALERLAERSDAVDLPTEPRGPRASTRRNPAGLTNRQVEVLQLVAEGLTNAEIAERLYRSEKTIEHHVSAILTKLDARNRTEAAQRAAELRLVQH